MKITVEQAAERLLANDKILIVSHKNPDGDTLGSAYALCYALTAMGKQVRVACSDPVPERYSYFTGEYQDSDFEPEYVVAVDIAAIQLLGEAMLPYADRFDLCIDHHPSNELFAKETCLNAKAAAACEIIYDVLVCMKAAFNTTIANCIYTGLSTDTGCFKYSSTTKHSHLVAADLYDYGVEHEFINRVMFETKSKSRILMEQRALNAIQYFYDDRVAMITITQQMIDETKADKTELDGISSIPRTIEGVQVGITLREEADGSGYRLSVRTTNAVNASKLCAIFGGGGHKRAAGCSINTDLETVKKQLLEALQDFMAPGL